jgi:pyridoxine 4-dehydrogenase
MTNDAELGGTLTLAEDLLVNRIGYGTMQLAGPGVFGPPKDQDAAIAVLHEALELGINHTVVLPKDAVDELNTIAS